MAKVPIQIPIGGGLRTDVDPKLLPLGSVLELENSRQVLTGELVKRYGGNALGNAVNSSVVSDLSTVPIWQLANFRDDLIRLSKVGPTPISRWSPTMGKWTYSNWGAYSNLQPSIQSALHGPFSTTTTPVSALGVDTNAKQPDVAVGGGYVFTAFTLLGAALNHGTVVLVATDAATNEAVWTYSVTGVLNRSPRLAISGDYLVLAWVNDNTHNIDALTVAISTILSAAPTIVATAAVGTTVHATGPWFDVIADGLNVAMAWRTSTNKTFGAEFTASSGAHINYEILTSGAASIDPKDTLAFIQNPVGYANLGIVTTNHSAVGVQVNAGFRGTGASFQTHILDASAPAAAYLTCTGVFTTTSATAEVNVVYADSTNNCVKFAEFTGGGTYFGNMVRTVSLASKMFSLNGENYVIAQYLGPTGVNNTPYTTFVMLRVVKNQLSTPPSPSGAAPAPLAKIMPGNAAVGASLSSVVPAPAGVGAGWVTALCRFNRFRSDAMTFPAITQFNGVSNVTINTDAVLGRPVEAADSLYTPGALLAAFDGQTYADDGFPVLPAIGAIAASGTPGGLTAGGIYRYVNVFTYTDCSGRVCWSAPSAVVQQSTGAGTSIDITCQYLGLTQRSLAFQGNVTVETHRTDNINAGADPNEFRLLHVQTNDPTLESFTFNDGKASTAAGDALYTTGGVLPNDITPGFSALAVFQNRLFGITMDFGRADLWYTDEFVDGQVPRWSSERVVKLEDAHGPGYALRAIDDKLAAWKRDAVYVVTGQGSDELGNGGTYQAQLVSSAYGSTNPQSICAVDEGVFFQPPSARGGMRLLTRGMSVQDAGLPAQQYADAITGSCLVPAQAQARFFTSSGRTLVYDLVGGIWMTYTGQPATHAVCWTATQAAYARAGTNDVVVEDVSGATYLEAGVWFGEHLATPYVQVAGVNGYQRFDRIQGIGSTAGGHILRVRLYRDDETTPFVNEYVTPGAAWDWEMRYSGKLSRVKVVLDEVQVSGMAQSAGPRMSALAMIVEAKAGLRKLPAANRTR